MRFLAQQITTALVVGLLSLALTVPSAAQWRPTQPVEIWVTFGRGAHADIWARDVAAIIAKHKLAPVPFKVVNIPKGVGVEAFPKFKKLVGDNHKLMLILPNVYTVPIFKPNVEFDVTEMTAIAGMGEEPLGLWVNSKHAEINSIESFVKVAKAKGQDFKMTGPPLGTPRALLSEMVIAMYGLNATYVGIKKIGSTARALAEKGFDASIHNPAEQLALENPNVNKLVALTTRERLSKHAKISTFRENGMDIVYVPGRTVVGPPGMSKDAQLYYAKLIRTVFEHPDWQQIRQTKGHVGNYLDAARVSRYMAEHAEKHKRWKMAVEELSRSRN